MSSDDPAFRNPDKFQVLPFREWMRLKLPNSKQGMVLEDLDLVPLLYGDLLGQSRHEHGKFLLVEIKNMGYSMTYAQKRLFGMMDIFLRFADPQEKHYLGCYLVWWDNTNNRPFAINKEACTDEQYRLWIQGKIKLPALDFRQDADVGRYMIQLHKSLRGE